jgi:uncharacterized protein (DUF2249 family)
MQALTPRTETGEGSDSNSATIADRGGETSDVVDLRERKDGPVEAVFDALEARSEGEALLVVASAAPVPLYDRLDERGWSYEAVRAEADEWRIRITADGDGRSGERLRRPRRQRQE